MRKRKINEVNNPVEQEKNKIQEVEDEDEDEIIEEEIPVKKLEQRTDCPYLDTIDRSMLDFDFEKLCSVTLSNVNVYACLICGKYFQGRGRETQAYIHSLQASHHIFINLETKNIYCLPDNYQVVDSLEDIQYVLDPTFTKAEIEQMDNSIQPVLALDSTEYLPGTIGLNNIKHTDYANSVLQALNKVQLLRKFFLDTKNYQNNNSLLVQRYGELTRKIWNQQAFKGQVSPHELMQAVQELSNKKFKIGKHHDPLDFLQWFLNTLHKDLGGTRKPGSSLIHQTFQGKLEMTTVIQKESTDEDAMNDLVEVDRKTVVVPFLLLAGDIPPKPLFKNEQDKNVIPQVPLYTLLEKYNGIKETTNLQTKERKLYKIVELPKYLILHVKRFTKNYFYVEKNPTIVRFPVRGLDLRDYVSDPDNKNTIYDLVGNIRHEGKSEEGTYSVHVQEKTSTTWYDIQDLHIEEVIAPLISVSEAYILIFEQRLEQ